MFKFLKVDPPSRRYRSEDVVYIPLEKLDIDSIDLADALKSGEPIDMEEIQNKRIAESKMEDYGKTLEEATNAVIEEVGQEFVELLNHILAYGEFSEESVFQLVEFIPTED